MCKVVDRDLESPQMAFGAANVALDHREVVGAWWHDVSRRREEHGDIESALQEICGLDGSLVTAIDEHYAAAFDAYPGRFRLGLSGSRQQGGHLGTGYRPFRRPTGRFAYIDESYGRLTPGFDSGPGKQRGFSSAAHCQGCRAPGEGLKAIELRAAKLVSYVCNHTFADTADRTRIHNHRVLTGTEHNVSVEIWHV